MIPEQILKRRRLRRAATRRPELPQPSRKLRITRVSKKTPVNVTPAKTKRSRKSRSSAFSKKSQQPCTDPPSEVPSFASSSQIPPASGDSSIMHAVSKHAPNTLLSPACTPLSSTNLGNGHQKSLWDLPSPNEAETHLRQTSQASLQGIGSHESADRLQNINVASQPTFTFEKPSADLEDQAVGASPIIKRTGEDQVNVSNSKYNTPQLYPSSEFAPTDVHDSLQNQNHVHDYDRILQPLSYGLAASEPNLEHPQPSINVVRSFSYNCDNQLHGLHDNAKRSVCYAETPWMVQDANEMAISISSPPLLGLGHEIFGSQSDDDRLFSSVSSFPRFDFQPSSSKGVDVDFTWPSLLVSYMQSNPSASFQPTQFQGLSIPASSSSREELDENAHIIAPQEGNSAYVSKDKATTPPGGVAQTPVGCDQPNTFDKEVFSDYVWEKFSTISGEVSSEAQQQDIWKPDLVFGGEGWNKWIALKEIGISKNGYDEMYGSESRAGHIFESMFPAEPSWP